MKRNSLFTKTFLVTMLTVLLSVVLFLIIFSFFLLNVVKETHEVNFNKRFSDLVKYVELNGISGLNTNAINMTGLYVKVSSSNSNYENEDMLPVEDLSGNTIYQDEATIIHNNETYDVSAYSTSNFSDDDYRNILFSIFPYFIGACFVVSIVVSLFFAKYFTKRINHLNYNIKKMKTLNFELPIDLTAGDEIQELENNLIDMYLTLKDTLSKLDQEIHYTKQMESDRKLFMKGAYHELKTPIMSMSTMLEGIEEGLVGYQDNSEYMNLLYRELQNMSKLVNEIIELTRLDNIVYEGNVSIDEMINEVVQEYEVLLQDKELGLSLIKINKKINMSEKDLKKVISNLLSNAIKYSENKSQIEIKVEKDFFVISNPTTHQKIDMKNIFNPFVTFDSNDSSHGLGLYIVDAILKRYDIEYKCFIKNETFYFMFQMK